MCLCDLTFIFVQNVRIFEFFDNSILPKQKIRFFHNVSLKIDETHTIMRELRSIKLCKTINIMK